jgi:hypothetical protein
MSIQEAMMTTIQQSVPLVCLDRIVFGCCGWGGRNAIGSNGDNNISGGEALGSENNNQQTTEVRAMTATGRSRGDDNVNNLRPCPLNTQQPAIGSWWGGGNKDDKEVQRFLACITCVPCDVSLLTSLLVTRID